MFFRNNGFFLTHWLPLILYCVFIFIQSALPSPDFGPSWPLSDKLLHFAGYFVLGVLICRAFSRVPILNTRNKIIIISIAFSTLYGLSDEFHQFFVSARQADYLDFLADLAGSVVGVLGFCWIASKQWGTCFK